MFKIQKNLLTSLAIIQVLAGIMKKMINIMILFQEEFKGIILIGINNKVIRPSLDDFNLNEDFDE